MPRCAGSSGRHGDPTPPASVTTSGQPRAAIHWNGEVDAIGEAAVRGPGRTREPVQRRSASATVTSFTSATCARAASRFGGYESPASVGRRRHRRRPRTSAFADADGDRERQPTAAHARAHRARSIPPGAARRSRPDRAGALHAGRRRVPAAVAVATRDAALRPAFATSASAGSAVNARAALAACGPAVDRRCASAPGGDPETAPRWRRRVASHGRAAIPDRTVRSSRDVLARHGTRPRGQAQRCDRDGAGWRCPSRTRRHSPARRAACQSPKRQEPHRAPRWGPCTGSPGRTRTSDQSVTPVPAVSDGGGLSHHRGPRRPVGGGRSWGDYSSVTP